MAGGYLFWFATNTDAALAQTGTFHMKKAIPYWLSLARGAGSLVKSTLAFNGVAFATLLLVFQRRGADTDEGRLEEVPYTQLLGRAILVTLLILAALSVPVVVLRVVDEERPPDARLLPLRRLAAVERHPGRQRREREHAAERGDDEDSVQGDTPQGEMPMKNLATIENSGGLVNRGRRDMVSRH